MFTEWSTVGTTPNTASLRESTVSYDSEHQTDTNVVDYEEEMNSEIEQNNLEMIGNLSLDIDDEDLCRFKFISRRLRLLPDTKSTLTPEEEEGKGILMFVLIWKGIDDKIYFLKKVLIFAEENCLRYFFNSS